MSRASKLLGITEAKKKNLSVTSELFMNAMRSLRTVLVDVEEWQKTEYSDLKKVTSSLTKIEKQLEKDYEATRKVIQSDSAYQGHKS